MPLSETVVGTAAATSPLPASCRHILPISRSPFCSHSRRFSRVASAIALLLAFFGSLAALGGGCRGGATGDVATRGVLEEPGVFKLGAFEEVACLVFALG